ncbi:DMT family transporter [Roseibium sp. HPY-6]|uniref:DMT family transporter n=1 Tax=Roseibium sp. HPY-6 TaxID=3229852 RepID=UPI00338E7302
MSSMDRPGLGIGLRILSGFLGAGMFVSVKAVSEDVPLGEIVFFRAFFALIPLIIFLWLRNEFPQGLATKRPIDHLIRSAFGALALFTSFAAIARLNVAEAILIAQLSPVLMAVAAVFLLSERITVWRVGGVGLGFAGVVVLVWPELNAGAAGEGRLMGYILGLVSAVLTALALIMVRSLNRTESPGAIALYFVIASMIGALFTLPSGWIMPDGMTLVLLISAGLFGGFTHIAMTLAFRYAEASRLAPFEYVALLWPIAADLLIFRLPLSTSFLLAAPLVLAGAALAAAEGRGQAKKARAAS